MLQSPETAPPTGAALDRTQRSHHQGRAGRRPPRHRPLDERDIQPASVDLHLYRVFRIFRVTSHPYVDVREPMDDLTELVTIADGEPFIVQPGSFVLGSHAGVRHPPR